MPAMTIKELRADSTPFGGPLLATPFGFPFWVSDPFWVSYQTRTKFSIGSEPEALKAAMPEL